MSWNLLGLTSSRRTLLLFACLQGEFAEAFLLARADHPVEQLAGGGAIGPDDDHRGQLVAEAQPGLGAASDQQHRLGLAADVVVDRLRPAEDPEGPPGWGFEG